MVSRLLVAKHPAASGSEQRVECVPYLDEIRGFNGDLVDAVKVLEGGDDAPHNFEVVEGDQIRGAVSLDGLSERRGEARRRKAFDPQGQSRTSGKRAKLRRNGCSRFVRTIWGPHFPHHNLPGSLRA